MAKELRTNPETKNPMSWQNDRYERNYGEKFDEYKSQNPGDVMAVVLNEEAPVASKRQYCAKVPAYKPNEEAKYSARSPNDFLRLEELALLYPVPSTSKKQHYPAVHPEVRHRLREHFSKQVNGFSREMPGFEDIEAEQPTPLGPEYQAIEDIQEQADEIAEAAIWYIGRAIHRNQDLPYQERSRETKDDSDNKRNYGDINYLALRAFLFSHIAPYYTSSPDAELVIEEPIGKTEKGTYEISGSFEASSSELKTPEELNRAGIETQSDVEDAVIEHVEDLLISLFRLGIFKPAEVPNKDPDPLEAENKIVVGQGHYQPIGLMGDANIDNIDISRETLEEYQQEEYDNTIEHLEDRLKPTAQLTDDGLTFQLTYLL